MIQDNEFLGGNSWHSEWKKTHIKRPRYRTSESRGEEKTLGASRGKSLSLVWRLWVPMALDFSAWTWFFESEVKKQMLLKFWRKLFLEFSTQLHCSLRLGKNSFSKTRKSTKEGLGPRRRSGSLGDHRPRLGPWLQGRPGVWSCKDSYGDALRKQSRRTVIETWATSKTEKRKTLKQILIPRKTKERKLIIVHYVPYLRTVFT